MADDAYDDDLFDDMYVTIACQGCPLTSPSYAGDVSSAPAPPKPIKSEAHLDDDYNSQPIAQEAPYAPEPTHQISAVDTGDEGRGGGFGGHAVNTEHFQDEEHHNGGGSYPPIGIKEDG
jgi:hypothetical protein